MNSNHHLPESTPGAGCDAVASLLPLVAQRLLEPDEAQAVRAHVSGCSHCRARLAAYDGLDLALRRHFEQIASSPIRMEELMRRVQHEEQHVHIEEQSDWIEQPNLAPPLRAPSAPLRPARRSPRRVFSWLAAIAAVLVIALITTALFASHHPAGPTTGKGHPTTNGTPPVTVYGSAYNDLSSSNSTIFALDGLTGKPRWTNTSSTTFRIRPVVQDGVFYIGASDGSVAAYRASDGKLLWSQKLLTNSVVRQVVDGVVYAYSLDVPVGQVQQASLYALNARTGQQLWYFTKGAGGLAVGGVIYVAGESDTSPQHGAIYALNAKDGSARWEYMARAGSASVSQVVDGLVYVIDSNPGGDGNVTVDAVDAATGQQRWSYPRSPVGQLITLGVDNGLLYLLSNEGAASSDVPPRELYAVNTSDGSVRWHVQLELGHIQALYSSGVIYVGMDDAVAAYRASDGQRLWNNVTTRNALPNLEAQGILYLYNADTAVDAAGMLAMDASTGNVLWQSSSGGPLLVKAAVNGLVYAITFGGSPQADNAIYALDSATGKVRWTYDIGHDQTFYLTVI